MEYVLRRLGRGVSSSAVPALSRRLAPWSHRHATMGPLRAVIPPARLLASAAHRPWAAAAGVGRRSASTTLPTDDAEAGGVDPAGASSPPSPSPVASFPESPGQATATALSSLPPGGPPSSPPTPTVEAATSPAGGPAVAPPSTPAAARALAALEAVRRARTHPPPVAAVAADELWTSRLRSAPPPVLEGGGRRQPMGAPPVPPPGRRGEEGADGIVRYVMVDPVGGCEGAGGLPAARREGDDAGRTGGVASRGATAADAAAHVPTPSSVAGASDPALMAAGDGTSAVATDAPSGAPDAGVPAAEGPPSSATAVLSPTARWAASLGDTPPVGFGDLFSDAPPPPSGNAAAWSAARRATARSRTSFLFVEVGDAVPRGGVRAVWVRDGAGRGEVLRNATPRERSVALRHYGRRA